MLGGRRWAGACLWVSIGIGIAVPGLRAQIGAAALAGDVVDPAGAPLPGVTVTVVAAGTNLSRTVVTDPDGRYSVQALAPGAYRVRVGLSGFRPLTRDGIRLATGETLRLDLRLEVGGLAEAVTVTADAPLLRSDTSGLGHVIDNRKIVDLPLNGRSFITLASLAPGVALPPPPAAPLPRINGGRPRTNEYLFDGISVLQPEPGQVAFFPNVDAIQEFKIESNSPPAEFGRFNGGVVNLTTKSGTNALRGSVFEFFRNEALNARNFFASTNPVKPLFRRNQFGGVAGGPIRRNQAFFFADYQGQRQTIGRTVISTVPTRLQRQGVFTEAIAGRVPAIYDPATTVPVATGGSSRSQFPGNTIPAERFDSVARTLLDRYPLPTSGGTANNYRRVENETVDQDQFSVRMDHRFPANRDQVFGRLTRFREEFVPVTPLPDGSGVTTGTLGPQSTTSWSFASSYQRTFSNSVVNELRIGDTRRTVGRAAAQLDGTASTSLGLPGIPSSARFPNTVPTFLIGGYQQLGSPPSTASDFGTSVTEIADTLTWLKGRHTLKMGADLRWERLDVVQPPSPTGQFTFSNLFTNLPTDATTAANTGTPLAGFLLGQVQQFSIDLQQEEIRNRAHFQEYFIQDDWRLSDRVTVNAGVRYTLNFPSMEENDQVAVFNLETRELEYLGRDGQPRAARQLHKLNFGPRLGVVGRLTDRTVVRTGYGMIWIEMAGITTPFTTPVFPFLQTVSQRTLDNITPAFVLSAGPSVEPIPLTPDAGLGQGVFAVDRDLGSGYVQQWNSSLQRELTSNISVEVAYAGSKITRVGLPDTNLNQLTVEQLAQGSPLLQRVPNPYFGTIPRSSSLGDPTITRAQLLKPYPQVHNREPVSQQRGHDDLSRLLHQAGAAVLARPVVSRQLHALQVDGRRLVGVRRVDSHGAGGQLSGRRQLQPPPRARLLDGGHSPRVRRVGGLGHPLRREPAPPRSRRVGRRRQRLDGHGRGHAAVGHPDRRHPDDQQQCVRGIRHAASEPGRRSGSPCRRAVGQPMVRHQRVCDGPSVHDWHEPAQPGTGTGLSQSRHRRRAPGGAAGEPGARSQSGDLQRHQHAPVRGAKHHDRIGGLRDDRARPAIRESCNSR